MSLAAEKPFEKKPSHIISKLSREAAKIKKSRYLLLILLPGLAYYLIFNYVPMLGIIIAFKDFRISAGFLAGKWVGLKHFIDFFNDPYFFTLIRNTLAINIYGLVFGFPLPIILALMFNEVKNKIFRRTAQTISYLPNFISIVIISGMVINFLSPQTGIINKILGYAGIGPIPFMTEPGYFWGIFTIMNVWKYMGWNSIIFLAAITGVDVSLYDAATVDGANRLRKIWHITLPSIRSTIVIILILNIGRMLTVGAEPIILLYNPAIYSTADVISTYVYRRGFGISSSSFAIQASPDYSFATAVGLFNSVISMILLYLANWLSRKSMETSLW